MDKEASMLQSCLDPAGPWLLESLPNESIFIWEPHGLCRARSRGQQDLHPGAFTSRKVPQTTPILEQICASKGALRKGTLVSDHGYLSGPV